MLERSICKEGFDVSISLNEQDTTIILGKVLEKRTHYASTYIDSGQ
jgi:hypothetical protein